MAAQPVCLMKGLKTQEKTKLDKKRDVYLAEKHEDKNKARRTGGEN